MPASEYKNTISGGLKLKGAKDAGVAKPKKKKSSSKSKVKDVGKDEGRDTAEAGEEDGGSRERETDADEGALQRALAAEDADGIPQDMVLGGSGGAEATGKTETQRRHEETRRKRLDERLRREGVKTHKERVEELNKYLSTLSEHHDMPRIGPG